ncbi:FUSC family protein, partial [Streptomyces hygroscopicus]
MRTLSAPPDWLTHPLRGMRALRGPVPWAAVVRGALGVGPVVAAGVASGHPPFGVVAGLGAMFAHINDRPGTRATRPVRIGLPALAGAAGLLAGAWLGTLGLGAWIALALAAVGLVSGAVSAIGPVSSSAGVQLMVAAVVGAGMPLPMPPPVRAGLLLVGAAWVIAMAAPLPRALPAGRAVPSGERAAVAAVYDALADLMAAVGTDGGQAARRRLTAAYDAAYEALYAHRLPRHRPDEEERRLRDRLAVAGALSEAVLTLLWEGEPVPGRIARTPAQLARSVRTGLPPGRLPAPVPDTAGNIGVHRAVLLAARVFDGEPAPAVGAVGPGHR